MIKKHHHFIAQTYLNSFTNAEGKVFAYRKDDPQTVRQQLPKELAFHKHYYRQPLPQGGYDHNSLEDHFAAVEGKWPNIVDRLRQKEDVNNSLDDLFQFMALHRVRVPAARDGIEATLAGYVIAAGRRLDQAGGLPPLPESLKHLRNIWDHVQVAIDPHQSIHAMIPVLRGTGRLMAKIGFGVLHNATDIELLTSDNPVVWFDPSLPEDQMRPYAVGKEGPIMFLFPVAPDLIIVGQSSIRERFANGGLGYGELRDRSHVERMNAQICRFAYETVFASVDTFSNIVAKYASRSPVVRTRSVPTDEGELIICEYTWGQRTRKPKWKYQADGSQATP